MHYCYFCKCEGNNKNKNKWRKTPSARKQTQKKFCVVMSKASIKWECYLFKRDKTQHANWVDNDESQHKQTSIQV